MLRMFHTHISGLFALYLAQSHSQCQHFIQSVVVVSKHVSFFFRSAQICALFLLSLFPNTCFNCLLVMTVSSYFFSSASPSNSSNIVMKEVIRSHTGSEWIEQL